MQGSAEGSANPRPERVPQTPRLLGTVGGPLLANHLLLLAGAFLVVRGFVSGPSLSIVIGSTLIAAGVAIEIWIIVWSARLVRRGSSGLPAPFPRGSESGRGSSDRHRLCVGCGWRGGEGPQFCPRCGKVLVRLPSAP